VSADDNARPDARRVLAELTGHPRMLVGGMVAVVFETVLVTAGPLLVAVGIQHGVVQRQPAWVVYTASAFLATMVLQLVTGYLKVLWLGRLSQDVLHDLRARLLRHLYALDLDFFGRERSGRVVARLTTDLDGIQRFLDGGLPLVLRAALLIALTLGAMAFLSVPLTLAVLAVLVPLVAATTWYRRHAYRAQLDVRERTADLLTHVNESLAGVRVVQAFAVEDTRRRGFQVVNTGTYGAKMAAARIDAAYLPAVEILNPVALAVVVGYGAVLARNGQLPVGSVVAFAIYLGRLFEPIQQTTELAQVIQAASASFARVFGFLDQQPLVQDGAHAVPFQPGPGRVQLEGVSFAYRADGPVVLRGIDLDIPAGQRVALVGDSGAGKSTLAKLLARFYDPVAGRLLVDGQDVREVEAATLRRSLTLVSQEGFLFDGTVAENIALARPGASSEDVRAACAALGIATRLDVLPAGLDTPVSNRGLSLSAGQRQLVALARAFMAEPRVLILDEATSQLDPATDALVERALRTLLRGRTAIVIAHRVQTALRADRVVLLEGGQVREDGPPATLLASGGAFAEWVVRHRDDEPADPAAPAAPMSAPSPATPSGRD
jgi:ABC-type multidrug transport system fused ATPase/permease subunit